MKKRVLLLFLASFMLMGAVSAASVWGVYKGNSKVRLLISGKQYSSTGVPPIVYNGQVMVPLAALKDMGIKYSWDSKNLTVTITGDAQSSSQFDINMIKMFSRLGDFFYQLEGLGRNFQTMDSSFSTAVGSIGYSPDAVIQNANKNLTFVIDSYNNLVNKTNTTADYANSNGFPSVANTIHEIMSLYSSSIDDYKLAFENIQSYSIDNDFANKWLKNVQNGSDKYFKAMGKASVGRQSFQTMIDNYIPTNSTNYVPNQDAKTNNIAPGIVNNTVNSRIDGNFDGFEYDKTYTLQNGQIWKQTSFDLKISLKLNPKVTIFKDGSSYYMIVDGVDKKVKVEQVK